MKNIKYEFVEGDEKVIAPGVVVKRIRATVARSRIEAARETTELPE